MKFTPSSRTVGIKGVSGVRFDVVGDISSSVAEAVTYYGKRAIASKGSFSLCIPGGSIVKACGAISKDALDWSKVHIFFANEGLNDFKCYTGAMESFVGKVGIPAANVHKVGDGEPAAAAAAYAALIASHPSVKHVHGVPSMDLVLLGTGEDGHVGSLHPNSGQLKDGFKTGKLVMPIVKGEKKSVAVSMDLINAAGAVILSAAGAARQPMVKASVSGKFAEWLYPAGLVKTAAAGDTVWLCDKEASPL